MELRWFKSSYSNGDINVCDSKPPTSPSSPLPGPTSSRTPVVSDRVPPVGAIRLRRRARQADRPVAVVVGVGDLLLCGVLLLTAIGVLFFEPTTRAEEADAWGVAGRVYGYWLAGGLVLFSVLGMTRTLLAHLATMLGAPVVLFLIVMLLAAS